MTPSEVTNILRQFNEWRRGDEDIPQFDPREIGEAIDAAIAMIDRLEAAESRLHEVAVVCATAEQERDELRAELKEVRYGVAVAHDVINTLRAKIEQMERQEPVAWGAFYFGGKLNGKRYAQCDTEAQIDKYILDRHRSDDSNTFRKAALYALPGAQPAPSHAFDDNATIAGLESAVTHLSVLLDSFRALLVEVNDVCGRDGHGGPLEDGESEIIDKVRAALSMTEAPPCAKGEEK